MAKDNNYTLCLKPGTLDVIPKPVWAAITISLLDRLGYHDDDMQNEIYREWKLLHAQGILPQKPKEPRNA